MKLLGLLALTAVCAARPLAEVASMFADFKVTFNRQYESAAQEARAMVCYSRVLNDIDRLNALDKSATYGINRFSDICPEDFKLQYHNAVFGTNRSHIQQAKPMSAAELATFAADSFDWRTKGAVARVKDQAQCGSCWAFSAVAAMEGAWKLAGHPLTEFSEEELVQCAKSAGAGCEGGDMIEAFKWVISHGGINSESGYPYTSGGGVTGPCNVHKAAVKVAKFSGVLQAPTDEAQIAAFLQQHGPLSIAVDAEDGWQTYSGGVKSVCDGRDLDHGVTLVGFGSDYWIVKNSWSSSWGEQGYIRLQRGVNCDGMTSEVATVKA